MAESRGAAWGAALALIGVTLGAQLMRLAEPDLAFMLYAAGRILNGAKLYRDVVEGSSARMGPGVRERLPELLWLYSLGITLFWVHDNSDGCAKTYQLIDTTAPVIAQLVAASRLPALRRTLRDLIAIADQLSL